MTRALVINILFLASCSTIQIKSAGDLVPLKKNEIYAPHKVLVKPIDEKDTLRKITRFEEALKQRASKLTKADLQLHDELLSTYIQLKNKIINGSKVRIPARSQLQIKLPSFCLNSSRAPPSENEHFEWVKNDAGIPYYKDLLKLASINEIKQSDTQAILWNLQNKTYWENYPDQFKAILQKIDSKAAFKLPSKIKNTVKNSAIDYLKDQIPLAGKIDDAVSFTEGEYYKYSDYARSIKDLTSQYPLQEMDALSPVSGTGIYSNLQSEGFSNQKLIFYNPTNEAQEIDLSEYYLSPKRKDVQRIGIAGISTQDDSNLILRLETALYGTMARLGVGFTPILGDVADIYELLSGKDFLSAQKLTWNERLLSGVGIIAGSGAGYRYAARASYAPEEFISKFEKGFEQVAQKELNLSSIELKNAKDFVAQTKVTEHGIQTSPTLRKTFESPVFKKTDFYVRQNGDVIPAKAYRYVPSNAPYKDELVRTGTIPENPNNTYLSFDKYDQPSLASERLQLRPENDAGIRIELDARQTLEDLRIPRGKFDTADYLEPLTKDYPDFGAGRGTQAVTTQSLQVSKVVDLKTGQVIYEAK